ncbi:MAG: hypothetical protein E6G53_07230 [Actinobacteria bacterium]|nr:MAG: hypothetical protein E6G53_07230 [Actinomycetota bacterium]
MSLGSSRLCVLAICLAGVALSGCRDTQRDEITSTIKAYYLAVDRGDRAACHYLAPGFRRAVEGGQDLLGEVDRKRCSVIYGPARMYFRQPLSAKDLEVEVARSEDRATASVRVSARLDPQRTPTGLLEQFILQRIRGRWRIIGEVQA